MISPVDSNRPRPRENQIALGRYALLGALMGFGFYAIVAVGILRLLVGSILADQGQLPWSCRVMSDPINGVTFSAFGAAMAILYSRNRRANAEGRAFEADLIAGDDRTLLLPKDAQDIRRHLQQLSEPLSASNLVRLLRAATTRSRAAWNAADVADAIRSQSEVVSNEIDSEYAMVRYLAWAIPSIGFIGTVLGIGKAMGTIGVTPGDDDGGKSGIELAAEHLNTAFDTTFVALSLSLILMYFVHAVLAKEDRLLTRGVDWCMSNFANRMHIKQEMTIDE